MTQLRFLRQNAALASGQDTLLLEVSNFLVELRQFLFRLRQRLGLFVLGPQRGLFLAKLIQPRGRSIVAVRLLAGFFLLSIHFVDAAHCLRVFSRSFGEIGINKRNGIGPLFFTRCPGF